MVTWKWHKFLCYFALWAGGIFGVITGIGFFSLTSTSFLFAVLGVMELGVSVLSIITALKLIGMKKEGVQLLNLLYIFSAVSSVAAMLGSFNSSNITNAVVAVAMIFVNKVYYEKRIQYMN